MVEFKKRTATALVVSTLMLTLLGCQKHEGPAESAGKEVDKAVQKTGEQNELPRGKPRGIRTAPADDPRVSSCIPYLDHLHTS